MIKIAVLGAAGTVTGSKYLLEFQGKQILIDAGLFQGSREWRDENWSEPPVKLRDIDAVLLTHAHVDHVGLLPRYAAQGLHAPVFATPPTKALAEVLLPDSGRLQEEEAEWRSRKRRSRHEDPKPLYTEADAQLSLGLFQTVPFHKRKEIVPGLFATWRRMGHILGAGAIEIEVNGKKIIFSGDIGRYQVPILQDPEPVELGDVLFLESTYGGLSHKDGDPKKILRDVIRRTAQRGGVVVIPAFAVGRTQLILFYLRELKEAGSIPDIPVIIDSPMARDATEIYRQFPGDYDEESLGLLRNGNHPFQFSKLHFIKDRQESKKLNSIDEPMVIISASGMLTGGRILHHLKHRISSPHNTILFVGYQAKGGRGDWIQSGAASLRLLGQEVEINAEIAEVPGLSAHADEDELVRWCRSCSGRPQTVVLVHGEDENRGQLAQRLQKELGWNCELPDYQSVIEVM